MDKSQVEVCENQVEADTLKAVYLYMIYILNTLSILI